MDKKYIAIVSIIILGIAVGAFLTVSRNDNALTRRQSQTATMMDSGSGKTEQSADKIQIYLFYPSHRCSTCIAIGEYAEKTVNESFSNELASGKIEFREINIDLPENQVLVEKFQASGSALYINSIVDGQDNIVEDVDVWRLTGDEAGFKSYLKGKIDHLLGK